MKVSRREAEAVILADPRWAKVAARDKASDGRFVYPVKTTGGYCRPSCARKKKLLAREETA
ncbi:MAG: Ada metal-binding domain-containing protein [Rhizomicrobium sp.]